MVWRPRWSQWGAIRRRVRLGWVPLSDSEFVGGFKRCPATAADHGGTIAARERIGDFLCAIGAIERSRARLRRGILRTARHEEENCSISEAVGAQPGCSGYKI